MFLFTKTLKSLFLIVFFVLLLSKSCFADASFKQWLEDVKLLAREQHGISQKTLDDVLSEITFREEIISSDRSQPEFIRTFKSYMSTALSKERISQGKKLLKKNQKLLNEIADKYGVSPQYILAFWGMETFYGKNFGNISVFNSLASLGYDKRRQEFFTNELINALKIVDSKEISHEKMLGSWAGAMGNFQFMPSTYLAYAVDADNDGKKDLWESLPDSFSSAANYLSSIGWKKGEAWGREVKLPKNFDYFLTGKHSIKPISEWQKLGVKNADNTKLPNSNMPAWILLPSGHQGPAFFVYDNFDVIMKWNRSFLYALAIGLLADNISGRAVLINTSLKEKPVSKNTVIAIQTKLKEKGFYNGDIDGTLGTITKNALQFFQKHIKMPADGYPSDNIIKLLSVDSLFKSDVKNIPIPKVKPQYIESNVAKNIQ